jgi:predicted RNA-binding Zn ribbon-like protein
VLDRFGAQARLRFGPGGPRHEAGDPIDLTLAVVAEAMADGTWSRLKACPGPHCGWTFYDSSRNRSSQWCSMAICGNRVKGHAFRERRRAG